MQFVKWVILFFFLASFTPGTCRAAIPGEIQVVRATGSGEIQNNENSATHHLLNSFISILFINAGDLTDANNHNTYDKKNFPRLFIHFRYSDTHPQKYGRDTFYPRESSFTGRDQIAYYVYALQKIII